MRINVRRKTTVEIFIFAYDDYLYKAELNYGENSFKVRNMKNRIVLYMVNVSRMELDRMKDEIKKNIVVLPELQKIL